MNNRYHLFISKLFMDQMHFVVQLLVLSQRVSFYLMKTVLFELQIPHLVLVEYLSERVLHFHKHQLVLSHHVNSLRLQNRLLLFLLHPLFPLYLPVQFLIEVIILLFALIILALQLLNVVSELI